MRTWAALGILMSVPEVASADVPQPIPLELAWDAPASCPDESFVRRRVAQIVRGTEVERNVVVANARIEATTDDRFRLALTLRTGDVEETKQIDAATCTALAQATATIIALALDSSGDPAETPNVVPPPSASHSPAPPPETVPPGPRTSHQSWSIAPGAFTSITTGMLPDVSIGFGLSAALRLTRFRIGLLGALSLQQNPAFSKRAGVSFDMVEAGAWSAYVIPFGNVVGIGPSAGIEATYVHVRAFGIRAPEEHSIGWPTLSVGSRFEARLTHWLGLVGCADLLFSVGAPEFSLTAVDEAIPLHRPNVPSLRLSAGAEIVLP